ncbi:hypothetical protein GCM10027176_00480 [Actinoallomurus bryophytorum]
MKLVVVVPVEGGAAHHGPLGDLADGQPVEAAFFDELDQRRAEQGAGAPYAEVLGRLRQFALLVSDGTVRPD